MPRNKIAFYALMSLVCFCCGVGLLLLMLWNVEKLTALGLTGNLYYIVLLPLGLAAAGFLFGVLQSFAQYRGKQLGGVLQLGGPIVGFALVVIGGFLLPSPQTSFTVTVFVHGEAGLQDRVIKSSDEKVLINLGGMTRGQTIDENGQAVFSEIHSNYRGQLVPVSIESKTFEAVNTTQRLERSSVYLLVRKKSGRVTGSVQDDRGHPVSDAELRVAGQSCRTDSFGEFVVTIPGKDMQPTFDLLAMAPGFEPYRSTVDPRGSRTVVVLKRSP